MDPNSPQQPYLPPAANPADPVPYDPAAPQAYYPAPDVYPPINNAPQPSLNPQQNPLAAPLEQGMPQLPPAAPPQEGVGVVSAKEDLIQKLRTANNVLVTVSNNPSVDQLSAAIGLTLILNKLDKHATAVYSGNTPSTIEFLQPEKTLEKNTDSLRDFIIALDKAKADKLRYKVEDKFVKIFITPYHTSLSQEDLEFSQGDFNVDVVVAIGVSKREDFDGAITAHGRILHDAVTASVNNSRPSDIGAINWLEPEASSLSEMLVSLLEPLQGDKALLDEQIATSFLTGVVAETERFSNAKTTPHTMNIAATLMKAGANQQLVASKLNVHPAPAKTEAAANNQLDEIAKEGAPLAVPKPSNDGSLAIEHKKEETAPTPVKTLRDLEKENKASAGDSAEDGDLARIHIDDDGRLVAAGENTSETPLAEQPTSPASSNMVLQPPTLGGDLSSATRGLQSTADATMASEDAAPNEGALSHARVIQPLSDAQKSSGQTLEEIEKSVDSPHLAAPAPAPISIPSADAANTQPTNLEPQAVPIEAPAPQDLTTEDVFPTQLIGPDKGLPADPTASPNDPSAPPPVPPPLMPPTL